MSRLDFWDMSVREFSAAWHGHSKKHSESLEFIREWIYDSARWSAYYLAPTEETAKAVKNTKFPHEGGPTAGEAPKPLLYDDMIPILNRISKPKMETSE